jgi:ribose 1,5-bisphosphokinase PhnN
MYECDLNRNLFRYFFTAFVGRRSLFAEAFKHLREKPDYVFMRLVSTRPAADVDASVEVAVSDRDFLAYKGTSTFGAIVDYFPFI